MTPGASISDCIGGLGGKGGKLGGGGSGGKTLAAVSSLSPGVSFEVPAASMSYDFGDNPGGGGGGGNTTKGQAESVLLSFALDAGGGFEDLCDGGSGGGSTV